MTIHIFPQIKLALNSCCSHLYNTNENCRHPLCPQHRRHFSAVACEGCIYAVGGWYLESLVTPDSNTALYTAVERYDPWDDTWRFVSCLSHSCLNNMSSLSGKHLSVIFIDYNLCFRFVSSLPLTDFQFTMSLSHDVPLATSLGHCFYVLGSIQRTGEKLLLQYNTRQGKAEQHMPIWQETSLKVCIYRYRPFLLIWIKNDAAAFSLSVRLLVWTASHTYQSGCRPSCSLLSGCHWQAVCDWWEQLRECSDIILLAVPEMGTGMNPTRECVDKKKHHYFLTFTFFFSF